MIIKDNMANMCAKVTSTYMEFTLAFGPKPEFSFSFKLSFISYLFHNLPLDNNKQMFDNVFIATVSGRVVHEGDGCIGL